MDIYGRVRTPDSQRASVYSRDQKTSQNRETSMRLQIRWAAHRRVLAAAVVVFLSLVFVSMPLRSTGPIKPAEWVINPAHRKLVHEYVQRVLESQCRPGSTRQSLLTHLPASSHNVQPFLWKDEPLNDDLFLYPSPFGFRGLQSKVAELQKLLPASDSPQPEKAAGTCQRCVVMGNGGILKGLELGPLIDRFDTIIRLNRGPLGKFSIDVGNRTTIRMSYPEGTPLSWADTDPDTLFVTVVYKSGDISWTSAMINKLSVPLWDWFFFWQKVPDRIPLKASKFRLLNPHVIRETALDLLKYPLPRPRLWGWDQNIPTLGVSALTLASLLCDEVSLAGFGYNLSQHGAPLHYYDQLPMSFMLEQSMHNVNRETELLQRLVREGTITDLTGGIHCSYCHS